MAGPSSTEVKIEEKEPAFFFSFTFLELLLLLSINLALLFSPKKNSLNLIPGRLLKAFDHAKKVSAVLQQRMCSTFLGSTILNILFPYLFFVLWKLAFDKRIINVMSKKKMKKCTINDANELQLWWILEFRSSIVL